MSEPNAGSDVVSMKLKAEKKGKATCHKAAGKGRWGVSAGFPVRLLSKAAAVTRLVG